MYNPSKSAHASSQNLHHVHSANMYNEHAMYINRYCAMLLFYAHIVSTENRLRLYEYENTL